MHVGCVCLYDTVALLTVSQYWQIEEEYEMGLLKRKEGRKGISRILLAFRCIPGIPATLDALSQMLEVPKYVVAEHALQIGLGHIFGQMQDEKLKGKLQNHLLYEHHLADELPSEKLETDAIVDHMGLAPEQEELAGSALILLGFLKEIDIPPDVANKWIGKQISKLRVQVSRDKLSKTIGLMYIKEYHRQHPRLVVSFIRVLRKYPLEELEAVLDLTDDEENWDSDEESDDMD